MQSAQKMSLPRPKAMAALPAAFSPAATRRESARFKAFDLVVELGKRL